MLLIKIFSDGRFCNDRLLRVGGYALIAAMSGLVPMMFMTRVRLS